MLRLKIVKKRSNIHQKTLLKSTLQVGPIWEPTWLHFGGFWGPSWGNIHSQIEPKTDRNQDEICNAFLIGLGTQLASKMGRFGRQLGPQTTPKFIPKRHRKRWLSKSDASRLEAPQCHAGRSCIVP